LTKAQTIGQESIQNKDDIIGKDATTMEKQMTENIRISPFYA